MLVKVINMEENNNLGIIGKARGGWEQEKKPYL